MKRFAALLAVVTVVLLLAAPASAQATLTLSADAGKIEFGQGVSLSGTASGAAAGTTIDIRNGAGISIASATTDAAGAFSAEIHPQGTDTYVAVLADASSEPVTVKVRAVLSARMGQVRLFDHVVVRGTVGPARPGSSVLVELIKDGKTVHFFIVGRKGRPVLQRLYPRSIVGQHDTTEMKNPSYEVASVIADDIVGRFGSGNFDVAHLAYANFKSTLVQEPTVDQIIPVPPSAAADGTSAAGNAMVEYEPDEEEILSVLLPRNIAVQVYRALLENQAGFYGSQMTAMDNATRNAGDMINRLTIQYNRTRQAAITTELVEIISGAEAL